MIITNIGKQMVNQYSNVTVDNVIFSNFDLTQYNAYNQRQIVNVMGNRTVAIVPVVALLTNGHALVEAEFDADFNVQSAFIFATTTGGQSFLLAVDTVDGGSISAELNIDAIRKLNFNATSANIPTTSDMASAASSAYNAAVSYANTLMANGGGGNAGINSISYTALMDGIAANTAALNSNTAAINGRTNGTNNTASVPSDLTNAVASNTSSLANLAAQYDTQSTAISALSSSVNSLASRPTAPANSDGGTTAPPVDLTGYAKLTDLSDYAKHTDLANLVTSSTLDDRLITKANQSDLSSYAKSADVATALASKVNAVDLGSYATSSVLSSTAVSLSTAISSVAISLGPNNPTMVIDLNSGSVSAALALKADVSTLSNYATHTDLTNALSNYATSSTVALKVDQSELSNYATNDNVSSLLDSKLDKSALNDYTTSSAVSSVLADYAKRDELSNYVNGSNLDTKLTSYVTNSNLTTELASYAKAADVTSSINSVAGSFSSYVTTSSASGEINTLNSVIDSIASKAADSTEVQAYFNQNDTDKNNLSNSIKTTSTTAETIFNQLNNDVSGVAARLENYNSYNKSAYNQIYADLDTMPNAGSGSPRVDLSSYYTNADAVNSFNSVSGKLNSVANVANAATPPAVSTTGAVDPSTIFRGYITDNFKIETTTRPDGIYKISCYEKQIAFDEMPNGFNKNPGYMFVKKSFDDWNGTITVYGTDTILIFSWILYGPNDALFNPQHPEWSKWTVKTVSAV